VGYLAFSSPSAPQGPFNTYHCSQQNQPEQPSEEFYAHRMACVEWYQTQPEPLQIHRAECRLPTSNQILLPTIKLLPFIDRKSSEKRCSTKKQRENAKKKDKGNETKLLVRRTNHEKDYVYQHVYFSGPLADRLHDR